jgi:hypothetical protein
MFSIDSRSYKDYCCRDRKEERTESAGLPAASYSGSPEDLEPTILGEKDYMRVMERGSTKTTYIESSKVDSRSDVDVQNNVPPSKISQNRDILTLRKHSMDYFTKDGVILRTGYDNRVYWYLLCLKELWDNAADFLTKYYKGANDTKIITKIHKDDNHFRISVRNSNYKDIKVFEDKNTIFTFEGRAGTKQGVHVISRGLLGDAMKQLLSLGYVMTNLNEHENELYSKQWEEPLIIRHNGEEWKIWLYVDKVMQNGFPKIERTNQKVNHVDTEIELALPIVNAAKNLSRARIEIFCKEYATLTTDITLQFRILDDSTPPPVIKEESVEDNDDVIFTSDKDWAEEESELTDEEIEKSITANIISALTTSADKAIVNLEFPALHPISLENLNNANSAHTCTLSEFADRVTNAQGKDKITIHEFLQTYREGTQLPKTDDNQKTLEELVSHPERDKEIAKYYRELRTALPPAKEITLPYKRDVRKDALIKRISKLYDIDKNQKPVYKLIHGFYDDTEVRKIYIDKNTSRFEEGKGLIRYPYVFEIIAIPRNKPLEGEYRFKPKQTIFIGAVNYSTSPKSNIFEGEYGYLASNSCNIIEVLEKCGFHTYHGPTSKLPCIIIGNLITLRREPHGYDKSRIDIQPFSDTIIKACIKVASGIKTYRGDGYHFTTSTEYSTAKQHKSSSREDLDRILTNFLRQERGLP